MREPRLPRGLRGLMRGLVLELARGLAGGTRAGARAGTRWGLRTGTRTGNRGGTRTGARAGCLLQLSCCNFFLQLQLCHCRLAICPVLTIRPSSLPPAPVTAPPSHAFEREPQLAARVPRPRVRPRHVPLPHPRCHCRPCRPSTSFGVIIDILWTSPVGKSIPRGTPEALPKFCFPPWFPA